MAMARTVPSKPVPGSKVSSTEPSGLRRAMPWRGMLLAVVKSPPADRKSVVEGRLVLFRSGTNGAVQTCPGVKGFIDRAIRIEAGNALAWNVVGSGEISTGRSEERRGGKTCALPIWHERCRPNLSRGQRFHRPSHPD